MKVHKAKTLFYCRSCGNEHAKWQGKCSACDKWNTLIEQEVIDLPKSRARISSLPEEHIELLQHISVEHHQRMLFDDPEISRVCGRGLMQGSISLIAGEPGIGKSTLLLQLGLQLANKKVLYVSGEESKQQIKERAKRLNMHSDTFYVYTQTSVQDIIKEATKLKPRWLIIDSIQTISSNYVDAAPSSMIQLRESTSELQQFAKKSGVPVTLVGHINKEGAIAGPKVLEHIVDTVILFEGDKHYSYRTLRTIKNRFGSAMEVGIYEMTQNGLRPVLNPSEILLNSRSTDISGTSIGCTAEGQRSLFVEVQALVTQTFYGTPQRTVSGVEHRKIQLLSAVLEKRCGFQLGNKDIFVSLVGGIKTDDPAIDLAIITAIISSYHDIAIPSKVCFIGEVGLSGEIRAVSKIEQRIKEAEKIGFETFVCSSYNFQRTKPINKSHIHIHQLSELSDVIQFVKTISSKKNV